MGRYIARRLIQFIPVILGTMFLLHLLSVLTIQIVGDPVRALFGENAPPDEVIQQLQVAYNLDDPCLKDSWNPCFSLFIDRMGQYIQGDFGVNYQGRAVSELFLERIGVTLRLTTLAILFETIVGITLGVLAGLRKDKFLDNLVKVFTSVLVAFPTFVLRLADAAGARPQARPVPPREHVGAGVAGPDVPGRLQPRLPVAEPVPARPCAWRGSRSPPWPG